MLARLVATKTKGLTHQLPCRCNPKFVHQPHQRYANSLPPSNLPSHPSVPTNAELVDKYNKYAYLFEEELPPHIKYRDLYDRHKQLVVFSYVDEFEPKIAADTFIASNSTICGNVEVWDRSSIWYGVVIRGDRQLVRVGNYSNIQDGTVITEVDGPIHYDHDGSTIIGHFVTIGHNCQLSACTIEDRCLVGIYSMLCPDSYMEQNSMLGAYSVLASGSRVPSGELWIGNPAKFKRHLTDDEIHGLEDSARRYWKFATEHLDEFFLPIGTNYIEAQKLDPSIGCRIFEYSSAKQKTNHHG